jgi:hypothetical protein
MSINYDEHYPVSLSQLYTEDQCSNSGHLSILRVIFLTKIGYLTKKKIMMII